MWITSGGKKTGAAVLARTSCQSGRFRLQSFWSRRLNFAFGLFEMGHGESVDALRITISSSVRSLSVPSVASPSPSEPITDLISAANAFCANNEEDVRVPMALKNLAANALEPNLRASRRSTFAGSNIVCALER